MHSLGVFTREGRKGYANPFSMREERKGEKRKERTLRLGRLVRRGGEEMQGKRIRYAILIIYHYGEKEKGKVRPNLDPSIPGKGNKKIKKRNRGTLVPF